MRVIGIDPGIDDASYAIIDNGSLIEAGIIRNSYKPKGKIEKLLKANVMALDLRNKLLELEHVDYAIVEASASSSHGLRNFNTMCRMAMVSGAALGAVNADFIEFVPPPTWKEKKDKLDNHAVMLAKVSQHERNKLQKFAEKTIASKRHNVIDAYLIALWGYNQYS
jgi:hypothetical protein